jgi:hypothetical protein
VSYQKCQPQFSTATGELSENVWISSLIRNSLAPPPLGGVVGAGVGVGVGVGFVVGVGVGVGFDVGVGVGVGETTVPTSETSSITTVFNLLKRSVNQLLGAEGKGPTLNETVFQTEEAEQTTNLLYTCKELVWQRKNASNAAEALYVKVNVYVSPAVGFSIGLLNAMYPLGLGVLQLVTAIFPA